MSSLYHISTTLSAIIGRVLADAEDDPTAADELDIMLGKLDAELDAKAEDYACVIRELEARSAARAAEAKRIRALAAADAALAERLSNRLRDAMVAAGRRKIDTAMFALSVQGHGGKRPVAVDETAIDLWPAECIVTKREPDRDAIRMALEAGRTIVGCSLLPRGESLRIR